MIDITRIVVDDFATLQATRKVANVDAINMVVRTTVGEMYAIGEGPKDYKLVGKGSSPSTSQSTNDDLRYFPKDGTVLEDTLGRRYFTMGSSIYTSSGQYLSLSSLRLKDGVHIVLEGK